MYKLFDYYFDVCINVAFRSKLVLHLSALVHTDRIAAGDAPAISDTEVNGVAPKIKSESTTSLSHTHKKRRK